MAADHNDLIPAIYDLGDFMDRSHELVLQDVFTPSVRFWLVFKVVQLCLFQKLMVFYSMHNLQPPQTAEHCLLNMFSTVILLICQPH